jgi:type IV secretion system protein VirB6
MGIVQNPGYRSAVSAMLTLYIMFTALSYLAGNLEVTHTELIVRVGKIAIVSALLSAEYSWTFFNDYLFVYFIGGVEQILQIVVDAGSSGPGSPTILGMMIAPQTLSKLFSVLFVDWLGFIYIILFLLLSQNLSSAFEIQQSKL